MSHPDYCFKSLTHTPRGNVQSATLVTLCSAHTLAHTHLHHSERVILARRKQPKAKAEYLTSRWCIKQLIKQAHPELIDIPMARFNTVFNEVSKSLDVYVDEQLLDVNVVISHSHGHVAVALVMGKNTLLGLDIEKIDAKRPFMKLAAHYYPDDEVHVIGDNVENFFRVWTLKEAYAKAAKQNISTLLSQAILPLIAQLDGHIYTTQWQAFDVSLITAVQDVAIIDLAPAVAGESL
ncbi:4'-phosphopantetheinyl transferase family protein [Pseudoalteromonas sp. SSDWG2]|uniref:4'-phosphopantetheinyl transferase family protein n=1 Tax=Pseudoalteromonas sp. SSDWG2 TaxID=3139391 RepID=UPI003BAA24A4